MSNNWQQVTRCAWKAFWGDELLLFWSWKFLTYQHFQPSVWFAISILRSKCSEDIHYPLLFVRTRSVILCCAKMSWFGSSLLHLGKSWRSLMKMMLLRWWHPKAIPLERWSKHLPRRWEKRDFSNVSLGMMQIVIPMHWRMMRFWLLQRLGPVFLFINTCFVFWGICLA